MKSSKKHTVLISLLLGCISTLPSIAFSEDNATYKMSPLVVSEGEFKQDKFVSVKGVSMHYAEVGTGDPILLLHGNPTSSYLWRNITPFLTKQGRTIAVDLIGMGYSEKPNIEYSYKQHYLYLDAFIKELGLKNITIVGHDWGAALGWDYARKNPDNVKAIAFMEGVLPPVFPQLSYKAMGEEMGGMFKAINTPSQGEKMIIDQHMFVENILVNMINRNIGDEAHNAYRKPYTKKSSRKPLLAWPRNVPIAGEPKESVQVMEGIHNFMKSTDKPTLLLYAEPGVLVPPQLVPYYKNTIKNLETSYVGQGLHFIQEDQPRAIGRAISDWLRRIK
jgi:haloalkane dehalogenase